MLTDAQYIFFELISEYGNAGKNNMAEVLALGVRQALLVGRGRQKEGNCVRRLSDYGAAYYEQRLIDYRLLINCGFLRQTAWVQIPALPLNCYINFGHQMIFLPTS